MSIVDIMSNSGWIPFVTVALLLCSVHAVSAGTNLLMIEDDICPWCERWNEEVGVIYDKTEEGKKAPLMRLDIDDPVPEGVTLKGKARFTPTFVLLIDGTEVQRIEGYPGEDFFYPALGQMLQSAQ